MEQDKKISEDTLADLSDQIQVRCNAVQYDVMRCDVMRCDAVRCNALP